MRIQTLSAVIVFAVAFGVPVAHAQRGSQRPSQRPPAQRPPATAPSSQFIRERATFYSPTTPIPPMTNPIAPITSSPVQPFLRYGPVPEVVIPSRVPSRPGGPGYGRRDRYNTPVIVGGGYYGGWPGYYPYAYPYPYEPAPVPGQIPYNDTVPGQLPYAIPTTVEPQTGEIAPVPAAPPPVSEPEVEYFPEPNMIITPPVPERLVSPPEIGTSKADVLARYGDPWGTVRIQGKESLYFRGGLELVFENDRLVQVK